MSSSTADAANYSSPSLNAGGASDVIIVAHADGTLRSTAWHVVFDRVEPNNFSIDRVAPSSTGAVALHLNGHRFEATIQLRATAAMDPATFDSDGTTPPAAFLAELAASGLLKDGRNELKYSSGDACVRAFLYLWRASMPAVIFDVDGTVTLNDIAGQAAMLIDASPTHPGVCELVCELHSRGYALVYLTSRPLLGASGIEPTRRFLFEIAVDTPSGKRMPPAALITTTHQNSLQALADEWSGKSKQFKTNALKPLRAAFEPSAAAGGGLYAGFGNREKDALAYMSAGVPPERVFLLEPSSTVTGRAAVLGESGRPQQPQWPSYAGLLASGAMDSLFPRCVEHVEVT